MRLFFLGMWELVRATARGRLVETILELGFACEEGARDAGDWEMVRAVREWWLVRWARDRYVARLRKFGCSQRVIEGELERIRERTRRSLAEAERDLSRNRRA